MLLLHIQLNKYDMIYLFKSIDAALL